MQVKIPIDKAKIKGKQNENKKTGVLGNKMPTPICLSFFLNAHLLHMKYQTNVSSTKLWRSRAKGKKTHTHTHTHTNKFHRYFIDVPAQCNS